MPDSRRASVPGGTFFFTVVTHRGRRLFAEADHRALLGQVLRECQDAWPFEINAIVLLPDHLHAIWSLPTGDTNSSARWSVIKKTFTIRSLEAGGRDLSVSPGKPRRGGMFRPRWWAMLAALGKHVLELIVLRMISPRRGGHRPPSSPEWTARTLTSLRSPLLALRAPATSRRPVRPRKRPTKRCVEIRHAMIRHDTLTNFESLKEE